MTRKGRSNTIKNPKEGLPEMLKALSLEKKTKTIAAKVESGLAKYLKEHGGSSFIRALILQSLYSISESSSGS